jgi:hypothetical protein
MRQQTSLRSWRPTRHQFPPVSSPAICISPRSLTKNRHRTIASCQPRGMTRPRPSLTLRLCKSRRTQTQGLTPCWTRESRTLTA